MRRLTMEQMKANKLGIDWYTVWFVLYVLLVYANFNLHHVYSLGSPATFGGQLFVVLLTAVTAFLLSNGLGIIIAIVGLYDHLSDFWLYCFDIDIWLMKHGHGIGTPNFSFESIIMVDIINLCLVLLILLNLLLSAIRCRNMGLRTWMILIPLYNPLALLKMRRKR